MRRNKKLKPYETDASQIEGNALKVEQPKTVGEAQKIIKINKRICIRGGGSGLAGGCVPLNGADVVLDISKIDKIIKLDRDKKIVEVEAGVILGELQNYLDEFELEFPVNPSSHDICTIGGMIATNAVGSRAIKYGKTSNWVSWVDVLDGNGELNRKAQTELSDYAGMEGITGVIIRAGLKLSPKRARTADVLTFETIGDLMGGLDELKRKGGVSMIEYFDKGISKNLGFGDGFSLLVEYETEEGRLKGEEYIETMDLRDKVYPLLANEGSNIIEDPKIVASKAGRLLEYLSENKIPCFGHLSVGLVHPCFKKGQEKEIEKTMKFVRILGGSVSGEHGIGLLKKEFVDVNDKKIINNIKKRTDKQNKFNVGKVI